MHLPAVIVKLATAGTLASGGAASGLAMVHYQGVPPLTAAVVDAVPTLALHAGPADAKRPNLSGKDAAVLRGVVVSVDAKTRSAILDNGMTYAVANDLPLPRLHDEVSLTLALVGMY